MPTLVIGLVPHLVPASTMPAGMLDRAMTEPRADGRDEVIYLICTHPRVALGRRQTADGWRDVYRARGAIGGPFVYDGDAPWARVRFPDGVQPSQLGWAVLDPLLETVEGLSPGSSFDPGRDPEGEDGRHRHELLPWILDRHLELGREMEVDRGEVEGGRLEFRLEYIGKAGREALGRASGAHHKMSLILARTLLYDPDRLVYSLPCDVVAAVYHPESGDRGVMLSSLEGAVRETGLPRDLLVAAAEEALIAAVGAPENRPSSKPRRFPAPSASARLAAAGLDHMILAFNGLPERMTIQGEHTSVDRASRGIEIELARGSRVL